MSEFIHIRTVGTERAPKAEMRSTTAALVALRLYLIPITVKGQQIFDTYYVDMNLTGDIDVSFGIYEQTDRKGSSGVSASLVANSSVTANGKVAAFQTVALGANLTLLPGSYWIGFIFDDNGASTLTSVNSMANTVKHKGRDMYEDQGGFALPATVVGTNMLYQATVGYPIWGGIAYDGDVIP